MLTLASLAAFSSGVLLALASRSRRFRRATWMLAPLSGVLVAVGMGIFVTRGATTPPGGASTAAVACASASTACAASISPTLEPARLGERWQGKPRLVEFESAHCAVCARMAPIVQDLERRCTKHDDTIARVQVDDDDGEALAARYAVHLLPTFLMIDAKGEEVSRSVGAQAPEQLARMLAEVRGTACDAQL